MTLSLHNIAPSKGARKRAQRVGRGLARKGTTSGRGSKGQRARSGGKRGLAIKGMRMTMLRMPKSRGFSHKTVRPVIVYSDQLNGLSLRVISPSSLKKVGVIKQENAGVKILRRGALTKALNVRGCKASESVQEMIKAAGGSFKV
ncbi:50S ribosomal protein L15 [Candidatus Uhrbacteria bacterium]|nr:50S ribosomal protein L15 [Candidatus Uhrbacteria bacterium]